MLGTWELSACSIAQRGSDSQKMKSEKVKKLEIKRSAYHMSYIDAKGGIREDFRNQGANMAIYYSDRLDVDYSAWEITLYSVANGNMSQKPMNEDEFF